MTIMRAIYQGELRTEATHLKSGVSIVTDAPLDNQGKGESFSPTDLLSISLGSCMLTIMGIKARIIGVNIDGIEVQVEKKMTATAPRMVAEIVVTFNWSQKNFSPEILHQLKEAAITCPVAMSLHPEIKKTYFF